MITARFTVMTISIDISTVDNLCVFFFFFCICVCVKAKHGYKNLTGIDYSPASVELARNVLQVEDLTDVTVKVGSGIKILALLYR